MQYSRIQHLQHGRNARTPSQHANILARSILLWLAQWLDTKLSMMLVMQVSLGAAHINGMSNLQLIQVLTHEAADWKFGRQCRIHLDHERKLSRYGIARDGRVAALNALVRFGVGILQGQVLANGQAENVVFVWQTKGEAPSIVGNNLLVNEWDGNKVLERQDSLDFGAGDKVNGSHGSDQGQAGGSEQQRLGRQIG